MDSGVSMVTDSCDEYPDSNKIEQQVLLAAVSADVSVAEIHFLHWCQG